jgi:hypothetical protein
MGVPAAKFVETYRTDVQRMKVSLMNYMKALRTKQSHPALPFGIGKAAAKLVLQTTPEGYPIIPMPLGSDNWRKRDWEDLFTMYMGRHYSKLYQID